MTDLIGRIYQDLRQQNAQTDRKVNALATRIEPAALPTRAVLWHWDSTAVAGGAINAVLDASQIFGHYAAQAPGALNDAFTHSCVLAAGLYSVYVHGVQGTGNGILSWYVDDVLVATQDWYAGSAVYNVVQTFAAELHSGGYHVLKAVVAAKNASSSGYVLPLTHISWKQASDT